MKFTLSWLKEHLDTKATLEEIVGKLTAIGLELEGVENPADALDGFVVAKIVEAGPHPNADKLQVCRVDDGSGEMRQVVCGAPNARAGLKGVFAPPGTDIPGAGFTIKAAKIRDVESFGMLCAEDELGLGDDHDGIIELPEDAPVGTAYADYAKLDDPVIDISVTPNRQDCMGVRGVARDLAAAGLGTLCPLRDVYKIGDSAVPTEGAGPDVRTDDTDGCPAFYGQEVRGLTNGPAPKWMTQKLTAVGQKPISVLVDITNFVMLDLGRPLHVYDKAKLSGGLVARKAKAGEEILALNGKTYTLDETMTVIADDEAVHDIGGIMGGEHSGVEDGTTDVIVECAYFTPEAIARTGQKLLLTSDARQRFERGVDPAFLDEGLEIATWLIVEHCGGTASEVTRAGSPPTEPKQLGYEPALCLALGGVDVAESEQKAILERLGFAVSADWQVTVPTWRRDIDGPADLVEEVIRIVGLDSVPSTALERSEGVANATLTADQRRERTLRRTAAAIGLNEAINWSFVSESEAAPFGGGDWVLANPISEDLKVMRPSMLPGLLSAARRNIDRGATSVRLFELGRRYFRASDGSSDERLTLGLLLAGEDQARDWRSGKPRPFDAFDAKAMVEQLLDAIGIDTEKLMVMDAAGDHFHPGLSATLRLGPKKVLASFGMVHPSVIKTFGLKAGAAAAEIYINAIPPAKASGPVRAAYAPPMLQAVRRDFAFLADESLAAADLVRAIRGADKANIVSARLFDRFAGTGVPEGKASLAIEVVLQPDGSSYTDEELGAISQRIVDAAAKLGADLRG